MSSSRQFIPLIPDFSEPVSSYLIPEINSSTAMSRREVDVMFDSRFLAFENKIINLLSTSNKQSSADTTAASNEPPLNVMAEDMTMHAVFWVLNRKLNAAHGRVSAQTQVPEKLHIFQTM